MRTSLALRFAVVGLLGLILLSVLSAFAAGISLPPTNVGARSVSVDVNDVKPPACAGLWLTGIVSGSGPLTGTEASELIIGSAGADTIDGLGGNDCILGGGGDDSLTGQEGNDVCIGGPGNDTFIDCEVGSQ